MGNNNSIDCKAILDRLFKYLGLKHADRKSYRNHYKDAVKQGTEPVSALRKTIEVVLSEQDKNRDLNIRVLLIKFDRAVGR